MSIINEIYLKLPGVLKDMAMSIYGIKLRKLRYGEKYREYYIASGENARKTISELRELQLGELKNLFSEVYNYSPYYKETMENAGIDETVIQNALKTEDLLSRIPVLEKIDLRKNMSDIVSRNPARRTVSSTYTSGTTGMPMEVKEDADAVQYKFSMWRCFYDWMGLPKTFKNARFSGRIIIEPEKSRAPFWVCNRSMKQLFMSTYHLKRENMSAYIQKLDSFKPELIDGYPSAIGKLAEYMLDEHISLSYQPKAVATTAETLTESMKSMIEKAFRCPVYNQYASSEGAPMICQCRNGNMHLWIDTGVFEFVNKIDVSDDLEKADLVVTSFRNRKTPLIRYRIGDSVLLYKDGRSCQCGCEYPVIHSILGREDDILFTKEKGYVGRLDTAYKGLQSIQESQIVQTAIDKIEVYIVMDKGYSSDTEDFLKKNLEDRLGTEISYEFKYVDNIARGANGKFRSVIRKFEIP